MGRGRQQEVTQYAPDQLSVVNQTGTGRQQGTTQYAPDQLSVVNQTGTGRQQGATQYAPDQLRVMNQTGHSITVLWHKIQNNVHIICIYTVFFELVEGKI